MQLLSQVLDTIMAKYQINPPLLSIYKNFSLGFLWKSFHNRPGEGTFATGQA